MCISEFNNVSNFVFYCNKNETKYFEILFVNSFLILRNKTKLIVNKIVRFRISLWEVRVAVWVQLPKFCISL